LLDASVLGGDVDGHVEHHIAGQRCAPPRFVEDEEELDRVPLLWTDKQTEPRVRKIDEDEDDKSSWTDILSCSS
jgi:hypothetical protein